MGVSLFDEFASNLACKALLGYRTEMSIWLARCHRRHSFLLIRTESDTSIFEDQDYLEGLLTNNRHAKGLFTKAMRDGVFIDDKSTAVGVTNLANRLKIGNGENERSLKYYRGALEYFPNDPEILEGIRFLLNS